MNTETAPARAATLIYRLESVVERIAPARLFPRRRPLEVELGCGDGSFLAEYARRHPERNFLGVERLLGRLRKLDRKARALGLENVRCVRIEAAYFLEYLLPPGAAQAIHVYFPDPWPKRRHHKHRLINERFTGLARQALAEGGAVYLRTDDAAYFARIKAVFDASPHWAQTPAPEELAGTRTDFERDFLKQGVQTLRLGFAKVTHQ